MRMPYLYNANAIVQLSLCTVLHECLHVLSRSHLSQALAGTMPANKQSARDWADDLEDALLSVSSAKNRKRLQRLRSRGDDRAVCRRLAGRRPTDGVAPKSLQRREARWKILARSRLLALMDELTRLRVVVKTRLNDASDHRRMMRLTHALRSAGATDVAVVILMLFDRAMRRPLLSGALIAAFRRCKPRLGCGKEAAWHAVTTVRRHRLARVHNGHYWKGPAALHAVSMIRTWTKKMVVPIAEAVAADSTQIDAEQLVPLMQTLPHMTSYGSYHFMRSLRHVLRRPLKNDLQFASSMSDAVATLASVAPLKLVQQRLRSQKRHGRSLTCHGAAALVLCEVSKTCVLLGLMPKNPRTWTTQTIVEACIAPAFGMLLKCLETTTPLSEVEVTEITCQRAREAADVNEHLPPTSETWDHAPHYCKGSEMLFPRLHKQLQSRGWQRKVGCLLEEYFD